MEAICSWKLLWGFFVCVTVPCLCEWLALPQKDLYTSSNKQTERRTIMGNPTVPIVEPRVRGREDGRAHDEMGEVRGQRLHTKG
jgi:hypothetical protein